MYVMKYSDAGKRIVKLCGRTSAASDCLKFQGLKPRTVPQRGSGTGLKPRPPASLCKTLRAGTDPPDGAGTVV